MKDGKELGEFDGGKKSGWMGTLNDWFTNEGFHAFGYKNGKLTNGDEIHVMYTCDIGVDLGGSWGNYDTSLKDINISKGTLSPGFDKKVKKYKLIVPKGRTTLKVRPEASNKNYQVRTYLNSYKKESAFYKITQNMSVEHGDTIYVGSIRKRIGGSGRLAKR